MMDWGVWQSKDEDKALNEFKDFVEPFVLDEIELLQISLPDIDFSKKDKKFVINKIAKWMVGYRNNWGKLEEKVATDGG